MSSERKEQLKSLKQPDQLQVKLVSLMDWLLKNTRIIVGIVAVAAIGVGIVYTVRYAQNKARDGRLEELGKIQITYENEQRKSQDEREKVQKQIDEIEKKAPPAATGSSADLTATVAATPSPEVEPLRKKMDAIRPDHSGSATQFQEFFAKYENDPEGWMAGLQASRLFVDQQKVAEASALLDKVLEKSKNANFYQVQARFALISVLEDQGNLDRALTEVDQLDKLVENKEMKPRVLLAKGRLQLQKNQKDEAKATFNNLIENHGTSPEAQKARSIQSLFN